MFELKRIYNDKAYPLYDYEIWENNHLIAWMECSDAHSNTWTIYPIATKYSSQTTIKICQTKFLSELVDEEDWINYHFK